MPQDACRLLCCVLLLLMKMGVSVGQETSSCVQEREPDFRPDEDECDVFHRCVGYTLFTYRCKSGTVFSSVDSVCVHAGSHHDACECVSYIA